MTEPRDPAPIPASWQCLYCGNQHLNYEGPCVRCGTVYGQYSPPQPSAGETPAPSGERRALARALRRIAKGSRLSSLDAPLLDDAADVLDAESLSSAGETPAPSREIAVSPSVYQRTAAQEVANPPKFPKLAGETPEALIARLADRFMDDGLGDIAAQRVVSRALIERLLRDALTTSEQEKARLVAMAEEWKRQASNWRKGQQTREKRGDEILAACATALLDALTPPAGTTETKEKP